MKRAFESLLEGGEQAVLEVPEGYVAVLLEDGSTFLVPIEELLAFVHDPELENHDIKVHSGSSSEEQLAFVHDPELEREIKVRAFIERYLGELVSETYHVRPPNFPQNLIQQSSFFGFGGGGWQYKQPLDVPPEGSKLLHY